MNASARTKIERAVLALLVAELAKAGWLIHATDDGEQFKRCDNEAQLTARVFNLDYCYVHFTRHGIERYVRLTRGNDGTDMISDWNFDTRYDGKFNQTMKRVMKIIDAAPLRFVVKS